MSDNFEDDEIEEQDDLDTEDAKGGGEEVMVLLKRMQQQLAFLEKKNFAQNIETRMSLTPPSRHHKPIVLSSRRSPLRTELNQMWWPSGAYSGPSSSPGRFVSCVSGPSSTAMV